MRILFLVVALCGMLVASEETEFDEPSLCLQESNPFSYSHCIKKRDIGCQNGGFCGTCNGNSCQTCKGNSCKTTCNGNGCDQCPSGDCCNSENCNVCSGMNCCTSNNCNSCTNKCNNGCSTFACRSACLQTCQTTIIQCNCNWEQNTCFKTCRDTCIGDHCYENCFRKCKCDDCITTTTSIQPPVGPTGGNTTVLIENKPVNSNPVNISTIINLRNFISNHNVINNPINITNIQHTNTEKPTAGNITEPPRKCCYVIHPVHCFNIAEAPYKRCIQKRHWECSNICISVVVHLVHSQKVITQIQDRIVNQPYPVREYVYVQQPGLGLPIPPPVIQTQVLPQVVPPQQFITPSFRPGGPGCSFINQFPWIQCGHGHYNVQGCGSCYVCGNQQQFNPTVCSTQTACPGLCRGGLVYDNSIGSQILKYASIYGAYAPPPVGVPVIASPNLQGAYARQSVGAPMQQKLQG